MQPQSTSSDQIGEELQREKQGMFFAYVLSLVAGSIDAIGYIALFHMFTAHMSGNSAALGALLGQGRWDKILHRLFPIPLFVIGVLTGSVIVEGSKRKHWRSYFPVVLALEALLIALFMVLGGASLLDGTPEIGSAHFYALAALPAVAMGIQTACLHKIGSASVRTTFVTGMITLFCRELVHYLFWIRDNRGAGLSALIAGSGKQLSFVRMVLAGGIWGFYMIGAAGGAFLTMQMRLWSLSFPLLAILIAIAVDLNQLRGNRPAKS